jgi:hypothetical protein
VSGIFGGGSSGGKAPKAAPLVTTNIPQTEQQALAADVASYNRSDADYAQRFPDLVAGRNYNVANAVSNLGGQTDPTITNALKTAGFGGTNMGGTVFQQARAMGQPILAKEQRDRNYFETLLSDNPQRAFGLSGGDVANIALANVGAQNAYNQGTYGTRVGAANAQLLQNAQNSAALYGAIGAIGSAGIKYGASQNYNSPALSYGYYQPNQSIYYGSNPFAGDSSYGLYGGG